MDGFAEKLANETVCAKTNTGEIPRHLSVVVPQFGSSILTLIALRLHATA